MTPPQLSKRAGFLLASVLSASLFLAVGPAPVVSFPVGIVSSSSSSSSLHESNYYYPDRHALPPQQLQRRAPAPAPAPPLKSDTAASPSSALVSDGHHIPATVAQGVQQDPPGTSSVITPQPPSTTTTTTTTTPPPPKAEPLPINKNAFRILNPEPGAIWTSGKVETMSWEDLDDKVTYDITLIPEDPISNPKALLITRRPILRYVVAEDRFLDMVIPYDLISKEQLLKVQESSVNFTWTQQQPAPTPTPIVSEATPLPSPSPSPSPLASPVPVIESRARLYITAYVGRTNRMIAQKSVYPLVIRKDPDWDRREPRPNLPLLQPPLSMEETDEIDFDAGHPEDMDMDILEKKDSDLTHHDDLAFEGDEHQAPEMDNMVTEDEHQHGDGGSGMEEHEEDEEEGEGHHHHTFGSWVTENFDEQEDASEGQEEGGEVTPEEITGENTDPSMSNNDNMHSHTHEEGEEELEEEGEGEGEGGHHHEHSHVIDPNHFQNDEDVAIWDEHADEPGYNPPIRVEEAGIINITRWIDNKERFFVGAPYVMAWDFPVESEGLTGYVNVYIEDAETAQRYDIVAGNLPSDVQFIYLKPSALLVSAIPKKKIVVRARVEMDLFWAGTIQRYTGFSKTFYVERGAL
ncbi:hypothetical protein BGZ95_005717 [Linnemannia exigua]|uniref:Uncharacterized protein n=1 Tax=Linnemannia exigua TaxID=604196 RepID=A0AAD4D1M4_9FUNG|nr:hypothetical protein BGZ95_005717 [Linnemannia exigua]